MERSKSNLKKLRAIVLRKGTRRSNGKKSTPPVPEQQREQNMVDINDDNPPLANRLQTQASVDNEIPSTSATIMSEVNTKDTVTKIQAKEKAHSEISPVTNIEETFTSVVTMEKDKTKYTEQIPSAKVQTKATVHNVLLPTSPEEKMNIKEIPYTDELWWYDINMPIGNIIEMVREKFRVEISKGIELSDAELDDLRAVHRVPKIV